MALVKKDENKMATTNTRNTNEKEEFNLFGDDAPAGKLHKLDVTEDAWERSAVPPKGTYSLQLFVGEGASKGVSPNYTRKGEFESYSISMMARITGSTDDYNDAIVWPRVSTRVARGKNVSTAAGLLAKLGYKVDPNKEYSDIQIARNLVKALEKSPVIHGNECDWRASYQKEDGSWENVYNSMDDFPKDEEGNPLHQVRITTANGAPKVLTASLSVVKWGGKDTTGQAEPAVELPKAQAQAAPGKAKVTPTPKVKEPEPEQEIEIDSSVDDEMMMLES